MDFSASLKMSGTSIYSKPSNEPTLLGLPLELRRQLFSELFLSVSHSDPCHWESHHPHLGEPHLPCPKYCHCRLNVPSSSLNYSILLVCRQVYEEALQILYEDTRFYKTCPYNGCDDWCRHIPTGRLSKLKHVRLKFTPNEIFEDGIAESIRLLRPKCPLLEDLELQLLFWNRSSEDFGSYIRPNGELMTTLSGLNLAGGLTLTVKDDFFHKNVAKEFRLTIAPEEMWHCSGWDYTFDGYYMEYYIKWVRAWSLGGSGGINLRFSNEPSEEDIEQIVQSRRFGDNLVKRLKLHAELGLTRSLMRRSIAIGRRLWERISR